MVKITQTPRKLRNQMKMIINRNTDKGFFRVFKTTIEDLDIQGTVNAQKTNDYTNKDSDGWTVNLEITLKEDKRQHITYTINSIQDIAAGMKKHLEEWQAERARQEQILTAISNQFSNAEIIIDPSCGVEE